MPRRYHELLTNDVSDTLEWLREHVLSEARELRAKRNWGGLTDEDDLKLRAQRLSQRVREKDDILGVSRGTRLLKHRADPVWGIDPSAIHPRSKPQLLGLIG